LTIVNLVISGQILGERSVRQTSLHESPAN
jgi:hypothetical protein